MAILFEIWILTIEELSPTDSQTSEYGKELVW